MYATDQFDVLFMYVYLPGNLPSNQGDKKLICCINDTNGFIYGVPIKGKNTDMVYISELIHLLLTNGLTQLVIVDVRSSFKWVLVVLYKILYTY